MSNIAFPFLVLPDNTVTHEVLVGAAGTPLSIAGDILPHWDYAQDLEILAKVTLDRSAAARALHVPEPDLGLALVLNAGTGTGSIPRQTRIIARAHLPVDGSAVELSSLICGRGLSARLRLELQIVLAARPELPNSLAPIHRGSRLWSSHHDILLEDGGDSRFPIELTSFSSMFGTRLESGSPWFVDWRPYALDADFAGTVRVYVNSDVEAVAERFVAGDSPTLQAILADVMTQMISETLDQDEAEDALESCEDGSVGHQVRSWLDSIFPGQGHAAIRALRQDRPGLFRASILAMADPGASS